MPSQRDTARSGRRARKVRSALNGPMLPIPNISAPRLTRDIYNQCDTHSIQRPFSSNIIPPLCSRCSSLEASLHCSSAAASAPASCCVWHRSVAAVNRIRVLFQKKTFRTTGAGLYGPNVLPVTESTVSKYIIISCKTIPYFTVMVIVYKAYFSQDYTSSPT